jgi:hypothetical protein
MAGLGYRAFSSGEVLTAANLQGYAVDQSVMKFATSADRTTALGASTTEGMMSYLSDINSVQMDIGTATFVNVDSLPIVAGTATRDALYPVPTAGNTVFRTDLGFSESYYGLYNASTNPGGATTAGWYPTTPITYTIAPGATQNPIPTTVADITGTSATFTVPYANLLCEIEYGAHVTINTNIVVTLQLNVNGSSAATTTGRNPTASNVMDIDLRSWYQTTLSLGSSTVKLRGSTTQASAATFTNCFWKITLKAPTKPLGV